METSTVTKARAQPAQRNCWASLYHCCRCFPMGMVNTPCCFLLHYLQISFILPSISLLNLEKKNCCSQAGLQQLWPLFQVHSSHKGTEECWSLLTQPRLVDIQLHAGLCSCTCVGSAKIPFLWNYKAIFALKNGCLYEYMHGQALILKVGFKPNSSVSKLHRWGPLCCCIGIQKFCFAAQPLVKQRWYRWKKGTGLIFNDTASVTTWEPT